MSELNQVWSELPTAVQETLRAVEKGMGLTADLSRSDLLLLYPRGPNEFLIAAQAQPHSIAALHTSRLVGKTFAPADDVPAVFDAWRRRRHVRAQHALLPSGAPVVHDVFPIFGPEGNVLALFSVEISLIQLERHHRRDPSFQKAVEWVKAMCMCGEMAPTEKLSPFSEWDGVLLVDAQRRITYLSGIANNLYRRLGYMEDLRGKHLADLNTADDQLALAALRAREPAELDGQEESRAWIRKVIPVWAPGSIAGRLHRLVGGLPLAADVRGVVITVHDATEERRKRQELKVKSTMIQEVHHRVKNNLQIVAAMLRMQARRIKDAEALQAIDDAVSRILSVAVIHEFLSRDDGQSINIRDLCQRILTQNRQVAVTPGKQIAFSLEGPNLYLPSQQATAGALVINELIQNALEHGFETQGHGHVRIVLTDLGDAVRLEISDDGAHLPEDFSMLGTSSLGLHIVQTLVQDDLHGTITLTNHEEGVLAVVQFPKPALVQAEPSPGNNT